MSFNPRVFLFSYILTCFPSFCQPSLSLWRRGRGQGSSRRHGGISPDRVLPPLAAPPVLLCLVSAAPSPLLVDQLGRSPDRDPRLRRDPTVPGEAAHRHRHRLRSPRPPRVRTQPALLLADSRLRTPQPRPFRRVEDGSGGFEEPWPVCWDQRKVALDYAESCSHGVYGESAVLPKQNSSGYSILSLEK